MENADGMESWKMEIERTVNSRGTHGGKGWE